jgi:hypothetical protein
LLIDWLVNILYVGLLVSWEPASWAVSLPEIGVFLLAAGVLVRQLQEKREVRFSPDTIALIVITLIGPIQVLAGLTVSSYQTWNTSLQWLALAAIYLLARTLLVSRSARARFLSHQVWAGSALAVVSVILLFTSPQKIFWIFDSRYAAFGPFVYKNHFAVFIELILPIAIYKMIFDARHRLIYSALFAALFACTIASLSRVGVVAAIIETIIILTLSWKRGLLSGRTLRNLGLPIVILFVIFSAMIGWEGIWNRFHEQNSFDVRNQLAASTIKMVEARPLTGFGLGTWRTVYPQFATFDFARVANEAHDDWLEWTAEGGVIFVSAILFFAVYVSRFAWKHVWGLGVPVVFLHCFVDYPTRNFALAAFLFLLAGALASTSVEKPPDLESRGPDWRVLSVRTAEE